MRYNAVYTLALTGFLALGMTCGAAWAQNDTTTPPEQGTTATTHAHQMNPDRDLARMTKHLKLTQDEQSQIKPILEDRDQQLNQLWQDTTVSRADRRTKAKQIRDDADAKITPILTDEQKTKYNGMETRHHHHNGSTSPTGDDSSTPQ